MPGSRLPIFKTKRDALLRQEVHPVFSQILYKVKNLTNFSQLACTLSEEKRMVKSVKAWRWKYV